MTAKGDAGCIGTFESVSFRPLYTPYENTRPNLDGGRVLWSFSLCLLGVLASWACAMGAVSDPIILYCSSVQMSSARIPSCKMSPSDWARLPRLLDELARPPLGARASPWPSKPGALVLHPLQMSAEVFHRPFVRRPAGYVEHTEKDLLLRSGDHLYLCVLACRLCTPR